MRYTARLYRDAVDPAVYASLRARGRDWGLDLVEEEWLIFAALDTPEKVQAFLNEQLYYNYDHSSADAVETAQPPRGVLRSGAAHCFEGALLAYAINELHGHAPRWVLLEASQDSEHNLVLFRDPRTGLYGTNAHSGYAHLDGRPARFPTLRAVVDSYAPYYYSDHTLDPQDLTLVGYSEPIDLVARFGRAWMASEAPLWDIYSTYIDDTVGFHYLADDSGDLHAYPLIRALKEHWLRVDAQGRPWVSVADLPPRAQELWHAFWRVFKPETVRPRGDAHDLEVEFMRLTGTTPIDLRDNAKELQAVLERGTRVEQLLTRPPLSPGKP